MLTKVSDSNRFVKIINIMISIGRRRGPGGQGLNVDKLVACLRRLALTCPLDGRISNRLAQISFILNFVLTGYGDRYFLMKGVL